MKLSRDGFKAWYYGLSYLEDVATIGGWIAATSVSYESTCVGVASTSIGGSLMT